MEETTGIATSTNAETAVNDTASVNPLSPDALAYQLNPNHIEMYPSNPEQEEMDRATLKGLLQRQLEYYFSRENLSTDEYLVSQMDADNYVAISTIAKFNQVRRLTDDHKLVVEVLRESAVVQVDEAGEKVRPNPRSGVLILREIPESTPIKEIEELFSGENCPKFSRCEFAHNSSWYVLFDSDEETQRAYQCIREEARMFRGKPVMARIKSKAITSAPFTTHFKNGAAPVQESESYNGQNQQQAPLQYAYANVPNETFNNQQVCPPFYPPTMLQTWAPTTPTCVDLGTVLSVNGLSPTQVTGFRPLSNSTNRHNYSARDRPVKAYTPQNYPFSRSEQNRYFNRGQSTSYLQRQQLQQTPSFQNIVNTSNCTFDYAPYPGSRSRNLHNFGVDMNFFAAPNLYYNKLPSIYSHTSQTSRHHPVVMQRSQLNLSAINCQDQGYLAMGSNAMSYSKESGASSAPSGKQSADTHVKENFAPNQRQRAKRWWKENGPSSSRNYSENSNSYNKSLVESEVKAESPKFELENTSFPPLPGCMETDVVDVDVYESRLSDIVKGTVKPTTRDTKTQTSETGPACATKDSSTITIVDTAIPSDGAFTPPASPEVGADTTAADPNSGVEDCPEPAEWESFADPPATDCSSGSTSINPINLVPEAVHAAVNGSGSFHPAAPSNSVPNGVPPDGRASPPEAEPPAVNVPSEARQAPAVKLPKARQLDSLPKGGSRSSCDLPSPKNKTPESSSRGKCDSFKERAPPAPKHRSSFSNSKNADSSSSNKERLHDYATASSKSFEHVVSKSSDFQKGHGKNKMESAKAKSSEPEPTLLSVNGHADSDATASSEDEKTSRKLTYSEVAMRAKDKVEKIAQELKEKERQEAMVRQHRQQDVVAPSRWTVKRPPPGPGGGGPPRI